MVAVGGVHGIDGKYSQKGGGSKLVIDLGGTAVGAMFAANVTEGVRLGIAYGQEAYQLKIKAEVDALDADGDSKAKLARNTLLLFFGVPVHRNVAIGAELAQVDTTTKADDSDRETVSYNIFRPGVLYHDKSLEAGLKYSPPINIIESDGSASVSRRWLAHAQQRFGAGMTGGLQLEHMHDSGIDDDQVDGMAVKGLFGVEHRPWGGLSGIALYRSKAYRKKENSSPLTIAQAGLGAAGDFVVGKSAHIEASGIYGFGNGKVKTGGADDSTSKLDAKTIEGTLALGYLF
jgi:hypothetical protein